MRSLPAFFRAWNAPASASSCVSRFVRAPRHEPDPVNLGTGSDISIRDLAELIARLTGFKGAIHGGASKPDGQLRRRLDTRRALAAFGWEARIPLDEGLRETIAYYRGVCAH